MKALLIGLHLDIFVALLLCLPLITWLAILPDRWFRASWHRFLLKTVLFLFWMVQIFLLFSEYYFFEEFKSRFNTVAVDYLLYPYEVFTNIWQDYPVGKIAAICCLVAAGLLFLINKITRPVWDTPTSLKQRALVWFGAVAAVVILTPTVGFREYRFSNERLLNEVANNGQVAFAAAAWTHNLDYTAYYKTLPADEALQRTKTLVIEPNSKFVDKPDAFQRSIAGSTEKPRLNVVILLEESLGSEFWGCLGRTNTCTPFMDQLAREEGMLFENLFASGNRTVRGFEGVLSSFPPLPGDSIVKRDRSENVETIARVLKRDGYNTIFLYGGRGVFDGMRSFAMNNGYDRFVEQKHFEHPTFTTIWGVCDEDLYDRSIEEFRVMAATGKPFFATVLSVSNHKPFTYPKGRIAENPDYHQRDFAVKYADYALGRFFHAVKKESFYDNTIFVVVADHGARVYGSQSIPIHSYEIPMLVVGPAVVKEPSRVSRLGGSLDVTPTILGMLGRPYQTMFFGRDLLHSPPEGGRVLLNHNRDIGMMRDNRMVVLNMFKSSEFYHGDPKTEGMKKITSPDAADLEIEKDAMALYQSADELYTHERYRVQSGGQSSAK
ncbi:LTA synthase family protein [Pedosphaera parvula]|uniref:LTA synthase family protein n=1 Tax=Pedosphaera parvula TaxID=1032527 RepID=UPI00135F1461|nr:LTA synthase family protein [Pedosphaera parvula]